MRESVPTARYSPVCNVLRQWKTSLILTYRVYRLYDNTDSMIIIMCNIKMAFFLNCLIRKLEHFLLTSSGAAGRRCLLKTLRSEVTEHSFTFSVRIYILNINMHTYITSAHGHELKVGCVRADAYNLILIFCIVLLCFLAL